MSVKNLSGEERAIRMRNAMEKRGINYDEYVRNMEIRKVEKTERKSGVGYRHCHEDDVQFGCCPPDVVFWA